MLLNVGSGGGAAAAPTGGAAGGAAADAPAEEKQEEKKEEGTFHYLSFRLQSMLTTLCQTEEESDEDMGLDLFG